MNKATIAGFLAALLGLMALIYWLASGSHFPVIQWPYEAFQGLAFTFGWVFGLSVSMSYLFAILVVITVLASCFWAGHKFARLL